MRPARAIACVVLVLIATVRDAAALFYDDLGGLNATCNGQATGDQVTTIPMHGEYGATGKLVWGDTAGAARGQIRTRACPTCPVELLAQMTAPVPTAAWLPDGNVVTATDGGLLYLITVATKAVTPLPSAGLKRIQDVTYCAGQIWIADAYQGGAGGGVFTLPYPVGGATIPTLVIPSSNGQTAGQLAGQLWAPQGVACAPGNIPTIADTNNGRIVQRVGTMTNTLAGGGAQDQTTGRWQIGYSGDNGVGPVLFQYPTDIGFAPDGTLFVADYSNHRVRRRPPVGLFTTVIGNGLVNPGNVAPSALTDPTQFPNTQPVSVGFDPANRVLTSLSAYDKRGRSLTDAAPPISPIAATATATLTVVLLTMTPTRSATPTLRPCIPTATVAPTGTPQGPCR